MCCGRAEDKLGALAWLCQEVVGNEGEQTLVFTSTRHHTELVHSLLAAQGISCACVYGAMDQVPTQLPNAGFQLCLVRMGAFPWLNSLGDSPCQSFLLTTRCCMSLQGLGLLVC